jgi:hypothetical protein
MNDKDQKRASKFLRPVSGNQQKPANHRGSETQMTLRFEHKRRTSRPSRAGGNPATLTVDCDKLGSRPVVYA